MIKFCNLIYFNLYKLGLLINEISVYPINNFLFKNNKKGEEVIKAVKEVSENKKNGSWYAFLCSSISIYIGFHKFCFNLFTRS